MPAGSGQPVRLLRGGGCVRTLWIVAQVVATARVGSGHPAIALRVEATPATAMARFML